MRALVALTLLASPAWGQEPPPPSSPEAAAHAEAVDAPGAAPEEPSEVAEATPSEPPSPTRMPAPDPPALGPGAPPAALVEAVYASRALPLPERLHAISEPLLDVPYLADPAGESKPPDLDPLGRYDALDCLTVLEEVASLALATDPVDAGRIRHQLRYGDRTVTYAHRHHFMELQWIPQAVQAGLLVDTTASYGATVLMTKEVTPDTWTSWRGRARFDMPDEDLPTGTMVLDVLPLDTADTIIGQIRPGSLVMTVRVDSPNVPLWITHVGMVLPGSPARVRHATHMTSSRVRDHDLAWYVRHLRTYTNWPAMGIAVFEWVDPVPRVGALSPAP